MEMIEKRNDGEKFYNDCEMDKQSLKMGWKEGWMGIFIGEWKTSGTHSASKRWRSTAAAPISVSGGPDARESIIRFHIFFFSLCIFSPIFLWYLPLWNGNKQQTATFVTVNRDTEKHWAITGNFFKKHETSTKTFPWLRCIKWNTTPRNTRFSFLFYFEFSCTRVEHFSSSPLFNSKFFLSFKFPIIRFH